MDKNNPPESFGVFKPVGHIVITFRSAADVQAAARALSEQGFATGELVRYTSAEMIAQVDAQIATASPMAAIGQDLNLIEAHRESAQEGCSFLVVHAPEDVQVEKVDAVMHHFNAVAAQRYGRFITEELIDADDARNQTNESGDTGLDDVARLTQR